MFRQLRPALISVFVIMIAFGVIFPLAITGIAHVLFPHQAMGSLITQHGTVVGSELIAQGFVAPGYFHPRPSAAGSGYDATSSGGTNLGPTSAKLINGSHTGKKLPNGQDDPSDSSNFNGVKDLAAAYRAENGLPATASLPADAVTRSASGLDPHISPANAALQIARVARIRGLTPEQVRQVVEANTEGRTLGFLGEPCVNVLKLNLALDKQFGKSK